MGLAPDQVATRAPTERASVLSLLPCPPHSSFQKPILEHQVLCKAVLSPGRASCQSKHLGLSPWYVHLSRVPCKYLSGHSHPLPHFLRGAAQIYPRCSCCLSSARGTELAMGDLLFGQSHGRNRLGMCSGQGDGYMGCRGRQQGGR